MINVYDTSHNESTGKIVENRLFSIANANIQDFNIHDEIEYNDKTYFILKKKFGINNFGVHEVKLIVADITS